MDLNLESSWTGYNQFNKGIKRKLRFSKSGKKSIEDRYATHYVDKKRIDELKKKLNQHVVMYKFQCGFRPFYSFDITSFEALILVQYISVF